MPSVEKLTRSLVRNRCWGDFREAGKIEPALAIVKNKKRPHANTEYSRELKDGDIFHMENNMAGGIGLARRGTC